MTFPLTRRPAARRQEPGPRRAVCGALLGLAAAAWSRAAAAPAAAPLVVALGDAAGDELAADDATDFGPWTVDIPPALRGRRYLLRIDGRGVPLEGARILVNGGDRRQHVELVDRGGRLLGEDTVFVDEQVFTTLTPRRWRLNVWSGSVTGLSEALARLPLSGPVAETTVEGDWQPGPLGLRAAYASQTLDDGQSTRRNRYGAGQERLEAIYEWTPLGAAGPTLERLHAVAAIGAFAAQHRLVATADGAAPATTCATGGGLAGLDLTYPVADVVWVGLRGYASYQRLQFAALGIDRRVWERGGQFGLEYTF